MVQLASHKRHILPVKSIGVVGPDDIAHSDSRDITHQFGAQIHQTNYRAYQTQYAHRVCPIFCELWNNDFGGFYYLVQIKSPRDDIKSPFGIRLIENSNFL